jgi:hypothetical protein
MGRILRQTVGALGESKEKRPARAGRFVELVGCEGFEPSTY